VPPRLLTNADLEKIVETSDEWITSRTGIKERHIVEPGQKFSDLATEAARKALDVAGVEAPVDQCRPREDGRNDRRLDPAAHRHPGAAHRRSRRRDV
jgi:hypothetical protein